MVARPTRNDATSSEFPPRSSRLTAVPARLLDLPSVDPGLLGREYELAALSAALDAAVAGRSRVVVVQGPSGYGRTRLLTAFARLAADPATVRQVTCSPSATGRRLGAAGDLLGQVPGVAGPHPDRLYRAALRMMRQRPLVLILDDTHWCDPSTVDWLDYLIRRTQTLPCLVVASIPAHAPLAGLGRLGQVLSRASAVTVNLSRLDDRTVRALVVEAGVADPSDDLVSKVWLVTRGNALLVRHLLDRLAAAGPDAADLIGWVQRQGREHVVRRQFELLADRLPAALEVAAAIAVLGRADTGVIGSITGTAPGSVALLVPPLQRMGLIEGDVPADAAFRSAARAAVSAARLADLRIRTARLLSDAGQPAAEVAGHLLRLPDLPEPWMIDILREAASQAENDGDFDTAVRCLTRVLQADPECVATGVDLARNRMSVDPEAAYAGLRALLARTCEPRARAPIAILFGQAAWIARRSPEAFVLLVGTADELAAASAAEPRPGSRRCTSAPPRSAT